MYLCNCADIHFLNSKKKTIKKFLQIKENFFLPYSMKKNNSVKFIEVFKSLGYRHLRNRVLENLQNFSE